MFSNLSLKFVMFSSSNTLPIPSSCLLCFCCHAVYIYTLYEHTLLCSYFTLHLQWYFKAIKNRKKVAMIFFQFSFVEKVFFWLFWNDTVAEYWSCYIPCQPFKAVAILSSDWHGFWGKVCCHSYLWVSMCDVSFFLCLPLKFPLVFSSLNMIYLDGSFLPVCFGYLTSSVFDRYL